MKDFSAQIKSCLILMFLACLAFALGAQSPPTESGKSTDAALKTEQAYPAGKNGVSIPSCSYMPNPPYTKEARAARFEGIVLVEGVITLDGKITRMKLIRGAGNGLDEITLKTLKSWKCKPATGPEGKPVPTIVTFQINFKLGQH